jgi:hypothetical protein
MIGAAADAVMPVPDVLKPLHAGALALEGRDAAT